MPDVQHNTLTGADSHEPKGASSASNETVYVADGAGSGAWQNLPASSIDTTGAANGDVFYSDGAGAGGWSAAPGGTHGGMSIANNATATTLTNINTYYKVTAGLASEHLSGITFTTDHITVPATGIYKVEISLTVLGQVNDEFHIATSTDGTGAGIIGGANVHHTKVTTADTTSQYPVTMVYLHNFTANDDLYLILKDITAGSTTMTVTDASILATLLKEA